MKLYAVRLIENKESVGIFHCVEEDLFMMVDEVASPYQCESTVIRGRASVVWDTPGSSIWDDSEEDEHQENPMALASLGSELQEKIFTAKKWKAFER
jgi:hypothetical protein